MVVACSVTPTVKLALDRMTIVFRALPINPSWWMVLASATALSDNMKPPRVDVLLALPTVPLVRPLPRTVSLALPTLPCWMVTTVCLLANLVNMWMVIPAVVAVLTAVLALTPRTLVCRVKLLHLSCLTLVVWRLVLWVPSTTMVCAVTVIVTVRLVARRMCAPAVLLLSCWRTMLVWPPARLVISSLVVNACLVTRTVPSARLVRPLVLPVVEIRLC